MRNRLHLCLLSACLLASLPARADVIVDWNAKTGGIVVGAKLPPPTTMRTVVLAQAAVFEAVNAITQRYPTTRVKLDPAPGASVDAAVAAASYAVLAKLIPAQQAAIDAAYQAALAGIPDGPARAQGIAVGQKATAAILALRADDGSNAPESYRPHTAPGVYVPTVLPLAPQWPQRKPWFMTSPAQFRPGPPPDLKSEAWARDYNEIKAVGARNSTRRTPEQTEMARFWEATGPGLYLPLVAAVAASPGREITQNARLYAVATQAMEDALISVFDAKYHYAFWRPITAIRNGDADDNDATERDPSWVPFIDTPMHPEYPCAHCIVAAAVSAVLKAEIGSGPMPRLSSSSPTAPGVTHTWSRLEDMVQEVSNARIYDGVHFRNSTEVGAAMGKKIGELAVEKQPR